MAAIGLAVAVIPEGLPAILTITLAIGVQRMARRNAITRKLTAVETLGSVGVICSDKTDTLTKNEMTVRHVITRAGQYEVEGLGYAPDGRLTREGREAPLAAHPDLLALVEVMAVCNDAEIAEESGQWKVIGEPTEGALRVLAAAHEVGEDKTDLALEELEQSLVFLGLIGIIDPPRPEAIAAIQACRQAGIRVKMITGDHAGTASAIGREMGITENEQAATGAELEAASDEDLRRIVRDHHVVAGAAAGRHLFRTQGLRRAEPVGASVVGRAHYRRAPLWTLNRLVAQCEGSSLEALTGIVEALRRKGLIVASGDDPPVYLPASALEAIALRDIVAAMREEAEISGPSPAVREIMHRIGVAIGQALQGQTLKDLVLAEEQGLTRHPEFPNP